MCAFFHCSCYWCTPSSALLPRLVMKHLPYFVATLAGLGTEFGGQRILDLIRSGATTRALKVGKCP